MALINDSGANDLFAALTVLSDPKVLAERLKELQAAEASHAVKIKELTTARGKALAEQKKLVDAQTKFEAQVQGLAKEKQMLLEAMNKFNNDELIYSDKMGKLKAEIRKFEDEKKLFEVYKEDTEAMLQADKNVLAGKVEEAAAEKRAAFKAKTLAEYAEADAKKVKETYEDKLKALKAMF